MMDGDDSAAAAAEMSQNDEVAEAHMGAPAAAHVASGVCACPRRYEPGRFILYNMRMARSKTLQFDTFDSFAVFLMNLN